MKYHFTIHEEENGYWAECCELVGCIAESDSIENLEKECHETLNLYLEEKTDSKIVFPLPNSTLENKKNILSITVDPEIALAIMLRNQRLHSNMTQKEVSEKLGMKNIYSYQRLEKKSNPTLSIIKKIHKVFPEIKFEYLLQ